LQYQAFVVDEKYSGRRALGGKNLLPLPHQIDAVYGKMLQMPKTRLLLADDPGAGKTIMAGMLIKELLARHGISRILILVPPLVLTQWQEELKEKFSLQFTIINRETLRGKKHNPFVDNDFCMASMFWSIRDDIKMLINEADFDFVIIDEAHKMAAYTHGKVKKKIARTKLYQMGETLLRQVENCLLLTATPHKGDVENFRHFMALLDHDVFSETAVGESLKDKSNPFIIRRLKEDLKNFDGTPLFPKRTTKSIEYHLSEEEKELYEMVTDYVRLYFNKALKNGNNSTAFALMLLQRRLSSSIQAIHLSLKRRRDRLQELLDKTIEDRKKHLAVIENTEVEEYEELDYREQENVEALVEAATDSLDLEELQAELQVLGALVQKSETLKFASVERKYQELERTIFGQDGLLSKGEKLLIFTESVDTLLYLEEKLQTRIERIAKITGRYSIEERRKQVELFKGDYPLMLATDAGGESINLQFCNQMINYDIPWNPNKLEQRMGRIHRIGQRNEVFVFNLVAANTREGDVMLRLLNKLEQMREDIGADLVYDFIGEVLEDRYFDLPTLMQHAILNREKLDEVIVGMEKTLSEEHKRLLEIYQEENLSNTVLELTSLRKEQYELMVKHIPVRCYADFCTTIFNKKKIRLQVTNEGNVTRIDRLPKFIRDFAKKNKIVLNESAEAYKYTGFSEHEAEDVALIDQSHSLFKLGLELTRVETEKIALKRYMISYPCKETMALYVYNLAVADGTGKELNNQLVYVALRSSGKLEVLDPYWMFQTEFKGDCTLINEYSDEAVLPYVYKVAADLKAKIKEKREKQLEKVSGFLTKTFRLQYNEVLEKLTAYQQDNQGNKNGILINQMNANLIDIEVRKEERLSEVERQRNIVLKPPKKVAQFELYPDGTATRVFPSDYFDLIEKYEHQHGRSGLKMFEAFALVDFYSERFNGEPRFILVREKKNIFFSREYIEDLRNIMDYTYVYYVDKDQSVSEYALKDNWRAMFS
jgi:superfamily II DNA or RNA helicase